MGNHRQGQSSPFNADFLTVDSTMQALLATADKVACTDVPVLIDGESGTGKEVLAQRIHRASLRAQKPIVSINCGAIQETLLLSELFGHEKGAFTGAIAQKKGLVELAQGGTLFLDEIGEMGLEAQAKLLRFLQHGEAYRVGGKTPLTLDVRIISATNRDLTSRVREGKFRQDLLYRINTVALTITPLRQRPCDVPLLAEAFLKAGTRTRVQKFSSPALSLLQKYKWPGNARELQSVVERFKILVDADTIEPSEVSKHLKLGDGLSAESVGTFDLSLLEKQHILKVLAHFSGNKTKAANAMGITVKTLYNKLARYNEERT